MVEDRGEVTALLDAWSAGEPGALDALLPLVIDDLRRMARRQVSRETPGVTLNATALVNELYLDLVGKRSVHWRNRAHFFATMAQLMRRILVDHARSRRALKHGGDVLRVTLDAAASISEGGADIIDVVALDEALDRLTELDARQGRIVEMRFFAGMTLEETAASLDVSPMTVKREWRTARLWLLSELSHGNESSARAP